MKKKYLFLSKMQVLKRDSHDFHCKALSHLMKSLFGSKLCSFFAVMNCSEISQLFS